MKRISCEPRENWQQQVEEAGFVWHTANGSTYWDESAAYVFSLEQIEKIESATNELYDMFLKATDDVIKKDLFDDFLIAPREAELIKKAWQQDVTTLGYGRFDFGFDGVGEPKMFEFNADTPTSLFEASVIQWLWKTDMFADRDQFNSIHEKLVEAYKRIRPFVGHHMHFCNFNDASGEDTVTTAYHVDCASEAGFDVTQLFMEEIGWNHFRNCLVDLDEREIGAMFKLYPWEWLVTEKIGDILPECQTIWLEPIYKMIWSNKRILPHLWKMFPDHKNLLRTHLDPKDMKNYVRKPFLAREGANITIVRDGKVYDRTEGDYDETECVYQELYELPLTDGGYPVIGSWVVNGEAAGMGIREAGFITNNLARFIPHIIE